MASSRMTNQLRCDIIDNAMKGAFDDEEAALVARDKAVGDKVYRLFVTEDQEKLMKKLPTGFFSTDDSFRATPFVDAEAMASANSRRYAFVMTADHRLPKHMDSYNNPIVTGAEIIAEIAEIEKGRSDLYERRCNLREDVRKIVSSVGTVAKLLVIWPEVAEFIPSYATDPKIANLPAMMVSVVTEALKEAKHEELAIAA